MKVLILSFYYYPDLCAGSFRATAFMKEIQKVFPEGTEFHVLTTMPNRYKEYKEKAEAEENDKNIFIKRFEIPTHSSGFIDQSISFAKYAMKVLSYTRSKKFDLIFATSSRLMTAFLGAVISKRYNSILYLDIRDLFLDTLNDVFPARINFFIYPFLKRIERFSFKQAKKINIVSTGFKHYFTENYSGVKLNYVSNGIDETFLNNPKGKYQQLSSENNKLKILYAGNIGEGQGLHRILPKLAKNLESHAQFFIIGDGGRKSLLTKEIIKEKCHNIKMLPPVNRETLKSFYDQADVLFLHLNSYDAFEKVIPSKIFEYSVYTKPIWAGVSGHSANFLIENISSSFVFTPCNHFQAIQQFSSLQETVEPRLEFIKKYSRPSLMLRLSEDVFSQTRQDK